MSQYDDQSPKKIPVELDMTRAREQLREFEDELMRIAERFVEKMKVGVPQTTTAPVTDHLSPQNISNIMQTAEGKAELSKIADKMDQILQSVEGLSTTLAMSGGGGAS